MTGVKRLFLGLGVAIALTAGLGPVAWAAANPAPTEHTLTGYQDPRLVRQQGEPVLAYVERATVGMSEAVEHSDADDPAQTWQVATLRTLTGGRFTGGEDILTPAHMRRGLCGQHSAILAEAMRRNGIGTADAYQIDGHVVVEFEHDGQTWVTDPDIGVGPFPINWDNPGELEATAQAVYADAPAPYDAEWVTPILTDTTNDAGEYPRDYLAPIADYQDQALTSVTIGRWVLLGVGLLLAGVIVRTSGSRQRPNHA